MRLVIDVLHRKFKFCNKVLVVKYYPIVYLKILRRKISGKSRQLVAKAYGSILEGLVDLLKYERDGALERA
ncbi:MULTISPECIES: hypothetical protein [Flavobacteriaceae]|uniref:hypothetical protein n=1 Tax=Flavobacteriaceae TaxID=49546 RepID=UPI001492C1BA|nr:MULTISPECIES: hypothetical protein [Allomuricauda]MDC6364694.1 hypothetical protein [Muricauda sp. AC10]